MNVDIAGGTNRVGGGCIPAIVTTSTYTVSVTMSDSFNVRWQFKDFPAGSLTFDFSYDQ